MTKGRSDHVREVAERDYVYPAIARGREVRIRVGDIEKRLLREGFPARHLNQICSALESEKFLRERMELCGPKGKPRRVDTIYQFLPVEPTPELEPRTPVRDPLLELRGVLRGAIREGADAFVREIRRDKGMAE